MGKVVKAVAGVALVAASFFVPPAGLFGVGLLTSTSLIATGAALALSSFAPTPRLPETQLARLNVRMDASAKRKAVFGTTAFPLDLRYHEATGTDQEYIHYIIAHAAHKVASIDEIYFEQDLAWTSGGGVQSKYDGYLTVTTRTEGAAGNEISISSNWGTGERLTGCAYTYIRIKRTGNDKKAESPLVSGLPSRITVVGQGALLYDVRLDSTVTGGSGSHRADDQTTWGLSYSPPDSYDNPALQLLWWLLGWKINGKLSVGCGVPPERIDLESFIEAANVCDEDITLSAGGSQDRYRSSGTASDGDDRMEVINTLLAACNGTLRDTGGKLSLTIVKNDLADYVLDLDDNDLLGEFEWQQTKGLSQTYNVVRGRRVDPSTNALYQLVDYPEVSLTSPDGVERMLSLDLPYVEDANRAQRIAKQVLQRNQYQGTFTGEFTAKALGCDVGEVVRLSLETLGWSNKLFRVVSKQISMDGRVPLTLLEENAAIYAWDEEESAAVTAAAPTVYDPLNSPYILAAAESRKWSQTEDDDGNKPDDNADVTADQQVTVSTPAAFNIQADSAGVTTTDLTTQTRTIMVYVGDTLQTSGVTVGTTSASPSSAITIDSATVSSGKVTVELSKADAAGNVTIPVVFATKTYPITISVNRSVAAPSQSGGAGEASVTDNDWDSINSTTYAQVTNDPMQVDSNGSGELEYLFSASFSGDANVTCDAEYSTDNSSWSTFTGSETTGTPPVTVPGEESDGFVSKAATTQTGLSANTTYYVRLRAKRSNGSNTTPFSGASFTVRQP